MKWKSRKRAQAVTIWIRMVAFLLPLAIICYVRGAERAAEFKVAAVQCYSHMGAIEANRELLAELVEEAASNGAKIIVLPECAVTGYMNPSKDRAWSTNPATGIAIARFAETVPGPSTEVFGRISSNRAVFICVPLAEMCEGYFFNSQILLNPRGEIVAHHRKKNPWPPGDALWVSEGDLPAQVVDTEFGRLGLMICYDVHVLPRQLSEKRADIVLYSIGWFGPNTESWFRNSFTERIVKPNHFAVIGANWTGDTRSGTWAGQGFSFIADKDGTILSMADDSLKPQIIYAVLPRPQN